MRAFMAALPHDQSANFVNYLEKYIDPMSPYIIGLETAKGSHQDTSGQHFHVCCNMTDKQYDSFRNTILKNHYGLRGQAHDGKPRQYGSVRNVRDKTKMLQYTVKDKNIIFRNFSLEEIQELIESSYHRPEKRDVRKEILQYLEANRSYIHEFEHKPDFIFTRIEKTILSYIVNNTENLPCKHMLKSMTIYYLTKSYHGSTENLELLYQYLRL